MYISCLRQEFERDELRRTRLYRGEFGPQSYERWQMNDYFVVGLLIYVFIQGNFYSAIAYQRPKPKALLTTVYSHFNVELKISVLKICSFGTNEFVYTLLIRITSCMEELLF